VSKWWLVLPITLVAICFVSASWIPLLIFLGFIFFVAMFPVILSLFKKPPVNIILVQRDEHHHHEHTNEEIRDEVVH